MRATDTDVAQAFEDLARAALAEDLRGEDATTTATVPEGIRGRAHVAVKQDGVVCGLGGVDAAMRVADPGITVVHEHWDGDGCGAGTVLSRVEGPLRGILTAERTALNLLGHLSGIATLTREFVSRAPGVTITDTRKTLPGLRVLQKYAVRCGGGVNHRFGLSDGVLVKNNHIAAVGSVTEAVRRASRTGIPVQCEVESPDQVGEALEAGADMLLLDNQGPEELRELVAVARALKPEVLLEASGGVTLDTVAEVAATGVDRISVGALTHSAPALDVHLKVVGTS